MNTKKKWCIPFFIVLSLVFCSLSPAAPVQKNLNSSVEYFADGSYIVTTLQILETRSSKQHKKQAEYFNPDNKLQWTYTLTAAFEYDGSASRCISVTDSFRILDNRWICDSHLASSSANTATGNFTMKEKPGIFTLQTISDTITIICDKNGNIS